MTTALQSSLKRLEEWGERWRIRFEPSKSQQLLMTTKATHPAVPDIKFGRIAVPEANTIKLLGVTFDAKLSFRDHLHSIATRGCQRLGVLRRACRVLDYHGRLCAYKGFVRPILKYAPLVWMGAASSHLARLDRVQKRAMAIIGPGALLQSLCHRRIVSGLVYLYKLQCIPGPPQLIAIIPLQPTMWKLSAPGVNPLLASSTMCSCSKSWKESTCLCFSLLPVFCSLSMEQLAKRNCKGSTQLEAAPHVQRRCA